MNFQSRVGFSSTRSVTHCWGFTIERWLLVSRNPVPGVWCQALDVHVSFDPHGDLGRWCPDRQWLILIGRLLHAKLSAVSTLYNFILSSMTLEAGTVFISVLGPRKHTEGSAVGVSGRTGLSQDLAGRSSPCSGPWLLLWAANCNVVLHAPRRSRMASRSSKN